MTPFERLEVASRFLRGADALGRAEDYAGAVSRCYYAAYHAMWAAVGDPPVKPRWEHTGLIKAFVRGRWDDPSYSMTGQGLHERFRFPLRRLYDLRLRADYRGEPLKREMADWALAIVQDLVEAVRARERGTS